MDEQVKRKPGEEVAEHIVELLQALYTATKTVHMYPPENPAVQRAILTAYDALLDQIPVGGALDLSYLEDKIIVNGEVLPDHIQKKGIIQSFHQLMKDRRISSITFWSGVDPDEIGKFLALLGTKAPSVAFTETQELDELMEEQGIHRIEVDEQIYVPISKREKVVDAKAVIESKEDMALKVLKDEFFAKFLAGEISAKGEDEVAVKSLLADPERMMEVVYHVLESKGWGGDVRTLPYRVDETKTILQRMSILVEQVEDPLIRSKLTREISKITAQVEAPEITDILLSPTGLDLDGKALPKVIIPLLEDQKLASVIESAVAEYQKLEWQEEGDEWPTKKATVLRSILVEARAAADGELADRLESIILGDSARDAMYEDKAISLGERLAENLMRTGRIELCDLALGPVLVVTAKHLFEENEDKLGALVLERVAEKFRKQSPDARLIAARQLWNLYKFLQSRGKEDYFSDLYDEVRETLATEETHVQVFSEVSERLDQATSKEQDLDKVGNVLAADRNVVVSAKSIERLMSTDTGKVVEAVFMSGDRAAQEAITRVLLEMEDKGVPALINAAMGASDDETLESIAESLAQMNTDPIPQIAVWFTKEMEPLSTINLIKLVAMIGDESSVSIFNPLVVSENVEVRLAVITALGILGGKHALQMLLAESADVEPLIRATAVRELGKFRDYLAVRRLMEIIDPKGKGDLIEDEYVLISACKSLGQLRANVAIPALANIATGKVKRAAQSEELRAAAVVALGMIGTNQARDTLRSLLKDKSLLVRSSARKSLEK